MRIMARLGTALLSLLAWIAIVPAAEAAGPCGVSGTTTTSIGNYNPFTGSGINQVTVTMNLTRFRSANGYTRHVDFYFVQASGSPAYSITHSGWNVLYTLPAVHTLSVPFPPPSGTVFLDFGGYFSPDTQTNQFVVSIPGGLDLNAGDPLVFDIRYVCDGENGVQDVRSPATLTDAMTIRINVLSALQASYAGPALDFGEIGSVSDLQAAAHSVTGAIRVASSGPYTVGLSSENGYRMTFSGGNLGDTAQTIRYSTHFLGQTKSNASPSFTTVACQRAGTGGQNLPITVTLQEGGTAKSASPSYRDTLTVTVTPLAMPYGGATANCPGL